MAQDPVTHVLEGSACSCGRWEAALGTSIRRGFDRHLLELETPLFDDVLPRPPLERGDEVVVQTIWGLEPGRITDILRLPDGIEVKVKLERGDEAQIDAARVNARP